MAQTFNGTIFKKDFFPERQTMLLEEIFPSDLTELGHLTQETVLQVVKKRYEQDKIYTSGGGHDILISVNPFKELDIYTEQYHEEYSSENLANNNKPHIFGVTTKAYKRLRETQKNQVLLVTGESGSGKTENTKMMIKHLSWMCGSNSQLAKEILVVNPLLEAFGNAKTILNNNSSRFAKYLELGFDENGQIVDATVRDYMLEKSRVVLQSEGEANFHIFYCLLAGLNEKEQKELKLDSNSFRIASKPFPKQKKDLIEDFKIQNDIMKMIGLTDEEISNVNIILAAILHITNIKFTETDYDMAEVKNERPMHFAATLLQIDVERFAKFLVTRKMKVGGEIIVCLNNKAQADEGRDALAKALYDRLFGWLVRQINVALHKTNSNRSAVAGSIGILDICGFESLRNNGLEQLCINIVNEKFQMFMNDKVFHREKQIFESEGLEWTSVEYTSNQDIVDLFFKEKTGILHLIDEDTRFQQATDLSLVTKLDDHYGGSEYYHKTKGNQPEFYIKHFAGLVKYNASGFLEKNGNVLSPDVLKCLVESTNEMISDLFTVQPTNTGTISGTQFAYRMSRRHQPVCHKPHGNKITAGLVRGTLKSLKDRFGAVTPENGKPAVEILIQKTMMTYFMNSMKDLLTRMEHAEARFIRCIKPNENQEPDNFEDEKVLEQLQYNGIAEVAQIRKLIFPVRFRYHELFERFHLLAPECKTISAKEDAAEVILKSVDADPANYRLGREQVFLKDELGDKLSKEVFKAKQKEEEERKRREEEERKRREEKEKTEREEKGRKRREEDERKRREEDERKRREEEERKRRKVDILRNEIVNSNSKEEPPTSSNDSSVNSDSCSGLTSRTSLTGEVRTSSAERPPLPPRNSESEPVEENKKDVPAYWDIFRIVDRELPVKDVHEQLPMKILKIFFYLLFFLVLLMGCVTQKVSLMVLLKQLSTETKDSSKRLLTLLLVVIPYALTSLVSFFKWLFGGFDMPSISTFVLVFIMESLHTLGMCLLIFRILPYAKDVYTGIALLSAVGILPAFLRLISSRDVKEEVALFANRRRITTCMNSRFTRALVKLLDVLALLAQIGVIPAVILWNFLSFNDDDIKVTILPVVFGFLFVSFGCWENFVDDRFFCKITEYGSGNFILKARYELQEGRSGVFMLSYLWKIILTTILAWVFTGIETFSLYDFPKAFSVSGDNLKSIGSFLGVIISSFVCYYIGYVACKLRMQIFSFSVPLFLSTPVAYAIFVINQKFDFLKNIITGSQTTGLDLTENWQHFVGGIVWWISLFWICRQIWFPRQENLAKFQRLFTNPMYCGILTTENLLLNRRRHNIRVIMHQRIYGHKVKKSYTLPNKEQNQENGPSEESLLTDVPRIYACATMWHENRVEMVQLLKSLHRLDADQWNRKQAMMLSGKEDPNFYEYEAHIFFDDALELDNNEKWVANSYVKMLVSLVEEACSCVHNRPMTVHAPYKVITPYGAQLVWQMPGENLLYVHVKDKNKIRHRKRWSQVMYMYYLLGYKLTKESEDELIEAIEKDLLNTKNRLAIFEHLNDDVLRKSENTFILALDGDTDFMPGAVRLLVDRMRKGIKVGAACGRIHPIGSGPLVWYQKFEYAIGHWLQKATEHVLGCVLCSPGCFSLFRGSALMDDNIIRKYAILPTEPGHYLQYEQGEDRWLCTLLLQQGYRVDYVAAADAFTYAPEGFNEFFNQRRRWMPSTLANIMDLLGSAKLTIATNPNISWLYIWYQMAVMFGTVIGPGTVMLQIAGSIQSVFGLELIVCYVISIIPPTVFIVTCYHLKPKYQLMFAAILSTAYAFLMLVVLVGTFTTAVQKSPFDPSVIFFFGLILFFIFAGLLHINEISCLVHGLLYLLSLPSGYLVLVIYSLCNLFNVSWGTREAPKRKTQAELEQEKKAKEEKKNGFFSRIFFQSSYLKEVKELLQSVGSLAGKKEENTQDKILKSLNELNSNFVRYASHGNKPLDETVHKEVTVKVEEEEELEIIEHKAPIEPEIVQLPTQIIATNEWLDDPELGNGQTLQVNEDENQFWKRFIEKYLKPLEKDEQKEKQIKAGLLELRDNYVFLFIMLNLLWIALNFMFQLKKPLVIKIPAINSQVEILSLCFVVFYLLILLIQIFGMIVHRWGTLQHMISVTEVSFLKKKTADLSDSVELEDALKFCQAFNHEPVPDYLEENEEEHKHTVLETAVFLGKSIHTKPELGKSLRQTIISKRDNLSRSRSGAALLTSVKQGIPLYLQGTALHKNVENADGDAISFVRSLRQSMARENIVTTNIKTQPSILRRRHLREAGNHVIDRVKDKVRFEEDNEDGEENEYQSLDGFGQGTMGRTFAKKMKYFKQSLNRERNGYADFGIDIV